MRWSNLGLAPWGYEAFGIRGLSMLTRCSDGALTVASYQPRNETWHWAVAIGRSDINPGWIRRATIRRGQWHDFYRLPFGFELRVSRQDFHKRGMEKIVG